MNKDDIIRMAREAGFERLGTYASFGEDWVAFTESLEAFANLVAAAEREACLDAMMQSTTKAVDTAMALEREACAKLCEAQDEYGWQQYADAIRARGNT
jgi:hypothetical protein